MTGGEVVVSLLVVDPQAGEQGGVGEPAATARRRRGEEGAPGSESGRAEPTIARVEHRTDLGANSGSSTASRP